MPFAQRIDIQNVSIGVSPVKRGRRPSTSPLTAENNTADDYASSPAVYSSYPMLSTTLDATHIYDDDEPQGMFEFDQWDALAEREGNYSIQDLPKDYDEGRRNLCNWSFGLVDKYHLDRSDCNIAMSYLDRLVSSGFLKKRERSLAMVTCLCIALKINSPGRRNVYPEEMAKLTNYYFTTDQIIDMETHIFESLKWMMNPPVPQHFLGTIECILKNHPMSEYDFDEEGNVAIIGEVRHTLYETATFLCELSVMETFFSVMMPSSIAIGAVLVAMDVMQYPAACSKWFTESLPLEYNPEEANLCAQQLHMLYSQQGVYPNCYYWSVRPSINPNEGEEVRTVTPTKEDLPPKLKRMRQEMTVGSICIEGEEEGVSPKKGRKVK